MLQIQFVKNGHDSFLDFIKAYAILGVIFNHTWVFRDETPGLGLFFSVDVPLFLLVQVFHFLKKDSTLDFKKIFKRVFLPYFIIQAILFAYVICSNSDDYHHKLSIGLALFGFGPGSYYPLIYIQMALLLLWFKPLFKRLSKIQLLVTFLILSEGIEIFCSFTNPPAPLYRLLVFRYVFLIYLGFLWVEEGIVVNTKMIVLSILSALTVMYFLYCSKDNEPWFFSTNWSFSKWPCYYWVSNGLVCILYYIWNKLKKRQHVCKIVSVLAKTSWEIFLMQMASIFMIKQEMIPVQNRTVQYVLYMAIIWTMSIWGGYLLNKLWSNVLYGNKHHK